MKKSLTESGLRSKGIDMRDKIKDIEYFNTFINEDLARVKKFSDKLENGEVKEDRILPVKSKVHDLKLGIMIAGYSKGDELTLLEEEYLDLFYDYFGYDIVPIAEVEYEDFICLDFRVNKQNPEIVYWNYELALENPIEGITLLYSSMDELIIELKKG